MAIQIGVQNLVIDVRTIREKIEINHVLFEILLFKVSATIPNKPANKLSVIFAIIQRKTVGEVQRTITNKKPIDGFLYISLSLKTQETNKINENTGTTNMPGNPIKNTNGIESNE